MVEITKENINDANYVDKYRGKIKRQSFIKRILNENKALMYMLAAFFIFSIANITLIYSFFKILQKL